MQTMLLNFMSAYGYFAIALLIAIENIFPPIPSEIILTFGGFMTTHTSMQPILVCLFATIGSIIGALVLYGAGRLMTLKRWERFLQTRIGLCTHLKIENIIKAQTWFEKHGNLSVFFTRFIPIVRSLISIPAGMAQMKVSTFLLYTTLGSLLWNTILISLGRVAGNSWERIAHDISFYSKIIFALFVIALCIITFFYWRKRRAKS